MVCDKIAHDSKTYGIFSVTEYFISESVTRMPELSV